MKKNLFAVAILMSFLVAIAFSCKKEEKTEDPNLKDTKVIITKIVAADAKQGQVVFDHNAHKKRAIKAKKNCKTCHHKGKLNEKCASPNCHQKKGGEQMIHKKCTGDCHATEAGAPKKDDCVKCHPPKK